MLVLTEFAGRGLGWIKIVKPFGGLFAVNLPKRSDGCCFGLTRSAPMFGVVSRLMSDSLVSAVANIV